MEEYLLFLFVYPIFPLRHVFLSRFSSRLFESEELPVRTGLN